MIYLLIDQDMNFVIDFVEKQYEYYVFDVIQKNSLSWFFVVVANIIEFIMILFRYNTRNFISGNNYNSFSNGFYLNLHFLKETPRIIALFLKMFK